VIGEAKDSKGVTAYKIEGRWSDKIYIMDSTKNVSGGENNKILAFEKMPYHEKY
jgi:hypothetical protein